jgi:hypothetical protein
VGLQANGRSLRVSTTDPDASPIYAAQEQRHLPAGLPDALRVVDGGKARVILDVLVTPAEVTENLPMLELLFTGAVFVGACTHAGSAQMPPTALPRT